MPAKRQVSFAFEEPVQPRFSMTAERTPLAVLIGAAGEAPGILSPTQTTVQNVPTAHWWAQKKRKRTVACGKCDACCRDDCGRCLNCCDKPKFGGPGARRNFPPACKLLRDFGRRAERHQKGQGIARARRTLPKPLLPIRPRPGPAGRPQGRPCPLPRPANFSPR